MVMVVCLYCVIIRPTTVNLYRYCVVCFFASAELRTTSLSCLIMGGNLKALYAIFLSLWPYCGRILTPNGKRLVDLFPIINDMKLAV